MGMQNTLDYLYSLTGGGIKLDVTRIKKTLDCIGNPHTQFKSIHIAGTKGKGSVSTFLYSCLKEEEYSVGIYTSPHLINFNERIKVNDIDISDNEIISLVQFIKEKTDEKHIEPTFFEFTTALAFLYFKNKNIDIAVIEVGLGGRLDATNVITPLLSVITTIGIDHTEFLGNTIEQIAYEKSGIIKRNIPIVVSENESNVIDVISEIARQNNSSLFQVEKDITYEKIKDKHFQTKGIVNDEFEISLDGDFQIKNAVTAILALNILNNKCGFKVLLNSIKQGLKKAYIPGRLEQIGNILLDGAHNTSAMKAIAEYLKKFDKKFIIILGIKEGKDIDEMISIIAPYSKKFILTNSSFKPINLDILEKSVINHGLDCFKLPNLENAIKYAKEIAEKDELILITGSLYLVGDALKILKNKDSGFINIQY